GCAAWWGSGPALASLLGLRGVEDVEALDQLVREHLLSRCAGQSEGFAAVVRVHVEIEQLAGADAVDGGAKRRQRPRDGLALRIEDARLGTDEHGHLHRASPPAAPTPCSARYASKGRPVSRS